MTISEAVDKPALSAIGLKRQVPAERPTPYVEVDELRLDRNMRAMQGRADAAGVALFPHIKTHKSVHLAKRQLDFGAKGVTAAKPSEALVFVEAGIPSIILAYPIVRTESLDALLPAVKRRGTELRVIAASQTSVAALAAAALRHGMRIGVFLKVDVGLGRIGVRPDDPDVPRLCESLVAAEGLHFAGLLAHAGHAYAATDGAQLAAIARDEATTLSALATRLSAHGIPVPCISVGATPTCLGAPLPGGINCIRPGNYVFLDGTALRLGICTADDLALSVVARVVAANEQHFIIDAGSKTMSSDRGAHGIGGPGYGMVVAADDEGSRSVWTVERLSEEHGFVLAPGRPLPIGSRVRVFPNHSCATIANFDRFILRRANGEAVTIAVDARSGQT